MIAAIKSGLAYLVRVGATDTVLQIISAGVAVALFGGALQIPEARVLLVSAGVALTVSFLLQVGYRYYRDRHEPFRVRKQIYVMRLTEHGEHVTFEHRVSLRSRQSQCHRFIVVMGWTGECQPKIENLEPDTTSLTVEWTDSDRFRVVIEFNVPLRRHRTLDVGWRATMKEPNRAYQSHLGCIGSTYATSALSKLILRAEWDSDGVVNRSKVKAREFRSPNDVGDKLKHPLRIFKTDKVLDSTKCRAELTAQPMKSHYYFLEFPLQKG